MSKSDKIIWGESVYPYDRADITMQTFTVKDSDVYGVAELDSHGYNNLYIGATVDDVVNDKATRVDSFKTDALLEKAILKIVAKKSK